MTKDIPGYVRVPRVFHSGTIEGAYTYVTVEEYEKQQAEKVTVNAP
jgi:hypothetical protein